MARIAGVDLPREKRVQVGLTYVYGIGQTTANKILEATGINPDTCLLYTSKEQIIFPEIDFEKVDAVRGMDVCFVTTAKTDEEGKELLKALGAPFAENN